MAQTQPATVKQKKKQKTLPPVRPNIVDELTAKLLRPKHPTNVGQVLHTFARDNHLRVQTMHHKQQHELKLEQIREEREQSFRDLQLEDKIWALQQMREERLRGKLRAAIVRAKWQVQQSFP